MPITTEPLNLIFSSANLFVLPFWGLMILVPNTNLARRVMSSLLPIMALATLYGGLFVTSLTAVDGVEAFSNPNLSLADLASLFANSHVMATGWVHYLAFDLFVGRWIYWQGQERGIVTRHSLLLCLFAGPLGLLCHWITDSLWQRWRQPESTV